jgi:cytoplasmic iron level regulating protein YaaA (DUF328/UPF0246 family)
MATSGRGPVVLIPPSEGKAEGGAGPVWGRGEMRFDLDDARVRVLKKLGARGKVIAAAPTMPALDRYTGVLYGALGYRGLERVLRRRVDASVVVFSGLWGLVAPTDPLPFYKLKMTMAAPSGGRLAPWWKPRIAAVLDPFVDGRVVWDLLPKEHFAAWPTSEAPKLRITARFLDDRGDGSLITVSHWNKLLKGALVRHVVQTKLTDPAGLAEFDHPQGYVYRPELTMTEGDRTVVSFVAPR